MVVRRAAVGDLLVRPGAVSPHRESLFARSLPFFMFCM